jgi:D-alanine-D-alanine ligase
VPPNIDEHQERRLVSIERRLRERARELAVFMVYDRPSRVSERPGLARTFFAQRCESDDQLEQIIDALRSAGAYVELFEGEQPFIAATAEGRLKRVGRPLQVVYNGMGWGIGPEGFQAGRKALVPLVCDSYGLICANADAYPCVLTAHKFHCFMILRALGIRAPRTWHYRPGAGWVGDPAAVGTKVIVKSNFEAWSVGVSDASVFVVDASCESRVASIANEIGQAVIVQEFIAGPEVYVPVLTCPEPLAAPPVQTMLSKAPGAADAFVTMEDNLAEAAIEYVPFRAAPAVIDELRAAAVEVAATMQLDGFSRIDFRIDDDGQPWVFDIAVSPGLEEDGSGATSLAQYGFDHAAFNRLVIAITLASNGLLDY